MTPDNGARCSPDDAEPREVYAAVSCGCGAWDEPVRIEPGITTECMHCGCRLSVCWTRRDGMQIAYTGDRPPRLGYYVAPISCREPQFSGRVVF